MAKLAIIVLAAGEGSRMKSETPKILHGLAGLPLIGHVLSTAHNLPADQVIAVLRHQIERITDYVHSHFPRTEIAEQDEIPGTGRAVEAGLALIPQDFDGNILILSGDVPLLDVATLSELIDTHEAAGNAGTLLSTTLADPTGYGRILRARQDFIGIVEQKDASAEELEVTEVNAGVYLFRADELKSALAKVGQANAQGEKYLTDVARILVEAGASVAVHHLEDSWLVAGVNDRAQLSELAAELNRRLVRAWQLSGVSIQDPASTWIDISAQLGRDAEILPGTSLKGLTRVGEGAIIGPDTTLTDVEVGAQARVIRTHAEGARIGASAEIGPFSYLRPGSEIGIEAKVGAFVEVKNSKIGDRSKVPHLSYVGDASIGADSNIGAGTIFANYDGQSKARTEIGSAVRTGSSNVFVAPVRVGDGVYTAAGTVIRKDVAPGDMVLNPKPQQVIAGWVLERRPGSASAQAAKQQIEREQA